MVPQVQIAAAPGCMMTNGMKHFMLLVVFLIACGASNEHLIQRAIRFGPSLDRVVHPKRPKQTPYVYDPSRFANLVASGKKEMAGSYMMETFFSSLRFEGSLVSQALLSLFSSWERGAKDLCRILYIEISYFRYDVRQILSILGGSVYVLYPRLTQQHYVKLAEAHLRAENALRLQLSEEQAMKICVLSEPEYKIIANLPMRLDWWKVIDKEINTLFRSKILAKLPELVIHDLEEGISSLRLNAKTVEEFFTYLKGDMSLSGILLLEFIEQNLDEQTIMGYFDRLGDGPLLNDSYQRVAYMIYKDHHQELHLKYIECKVAYREYSRIKKSGERGHKFVPTNVVLLEKDYEEIRALKPASSISWAYVPGDAFREPSESSSASRILGRFTIKSLESHLIAYAEKFGPRLEYCGPLINTSDRSTRQAQKSIKFVAPRSDDSVLDSLRCALGDVKPELKQVYLQFAESEKAASLVSGNINELQGKGDRDISRMLSKIAGLIYLAEPRALHVEYAKMVQRRIGGENLHCKLLRRSGLWDICKLSEEDLKEFSRMPRMMNWWKGVEQKVNEIFTEKAHMIKLHTEVFYMDQEDSKFMVYLSGQITLPEIIFFEFVETNISRKTILDLFEKINDDIVINDTYRAVANGIYELEYEQLHLAYAKAKAGYRAFIDKKLELNDWDNIITAEQRDSISALPPSKNRLWWLPVDLILSPSLNAGHEKRTN